MTARLKSARIIHADWSLSPRKRAVATATRTDERWLVDSLATWSEDHLAEISRRSDRSVLAGFDFPIGLPRLYADAAGAPDFKALLPQLGAPGPWQQFYEVCDSPNEIRLRRPFFPRTSNTTPPGTRAHLEAGVGLIYQDLLRRCERRTGTRGEASALFWLTGGKQVGRAAITGWREVIAPLVEHGVPLWPFDGEVDALLEAERAALVETYPAEFYAAPLGFPRGGWSKRAQADRRVRAEEIFTWAGQHDVGFSEAVRATIADGFGPKPDGEDPFDAVVGALGMINVMLQGRATIPDDPAVAQIEGWIFGQDPSPQDETEGRVLTDQGLLQPVARIKRRSAVPPTERGRIHLEAEGLPPKKDGAQSMWGKPHEVERIRVLRTAAATAARGLPGIPFREPVRFELLIWADRSAGDLDNFITGVCDGLMAVHQRRREEVVRQTAWPADIHAGKAVLIEDDRFVDEIRAERRPPDGNGNRYEVTLTALRPDEGASTHSAEGSRS